MANVLYKVVGIEEFKAKTGDIFRSLHLLSVAGDRVGKVIFNVDKNPYLSDVFVGDYGVLVYHRSDDGRGFENFSKVDVQGSPLS